MKVFVALSFVILLVLISLPLFENDGVVMMAGGVDGVDGCIRIPSVGIYAPLSLVCYDTCCYMGLWNGGRIDMDCDLSAVCIGDWARVDQEYSLMLECVSIESCFLVGDVLIGWRGIVRSDGDVLICDMSSIVVRVSRWIKL